MKNAKPGDISYYKNLQNVCEINSAPFKRIIRTSVRSRRVSSQYFDSKQKIKKKNRDSFEFDGSFLHVQIGS